MVKEVWDSLKDNIKERVTNPFLGTFLLVWVVQHWRVVYTFFNFDKEYKLQQKIDCFNKYWTEHSFIWNLIGVAFITVGVLLITYIFLALSRFLSNYFENVIIPFVYNLSKGKTVTYETYQTALQKIEALEIKVEAERNAKNEAIAEREMIEARFRNFPIEVENSKNDFIELIKTANGKFDNNNVANTLLTISKNMSFSTTRNEIIDFLLKNDLIETKSRGTNMITYAFTKSGNEFKQQYFKAQV